MMNYPNSIVWTIFALMLVVPFFYKIWHLFFRKKGAQNEEFNKTQINYKIVFSFMYATAVLYFLTHLLMVNIPDYKNFEDLTRFFIGLYATSLFALLYSITTEKKNDLKFENTINAFKSSIIDVGTEVEKLRENQPYFYPRNEAKDPNKQLFVKLSREIFEREKFIYEGENAVNASMCLHAINEKAKGNQDKTINVDMILKRPQHLASKSGIQSYVSTIPDNDHNVIDLFTTLYIIYGLIKSTNLTFRITIYKNNYRAQSKFPYCQFVNLTENSLFFSPHKKSNKGRFPHTFNFKNTGSDDCFYKQFKNYMTDRLKEDFNNETIKNLTDFDSFIGLFRFFDFETFAKSNYFEGKLKHINYNKIEDPYVTNQISSYFSDKVKEREKTYNECIQSLNLS